MPTLLMTLSVLLASLVPFAQASDKPVSGTLFYL